MTNIKDDNTKFQLSNAVDVLIAQREAWEAGTYAASNAELYTLLGNTLDLFLKVRKNVGLSRAVSDLMDTYGVQYNSATSLALKIVRLVFVGKGREAKIANRAYTYARVLTVAAEEGVTGEQLPKFIADRNGIDEIRRQDSTGESAAQKAQRARDFAATAFATQQQIASVTMTDELQPVDGAQYSLALVRKNEDGTGSIVFGTNNVAAVNAVLAIAGKDLREAAANKAEANVAKQDAEHRAENAELLMAELAAAQGFQPQMQVTVPVTEMALA